MAIINSINSNVTGNNTFLGSAAGNQTLTGQYNLGIGPNTLNSLTLGNENLGLGFDVLTAVTIGQKNVCVGNITGTAITSGQTNTIIGADSGSFLTTGEQNTLVGYLLGSNYTTLESQNLLLGAGFSGTALDTQKYFFGFIDGVNDVSFAHNIGTKNTFFGSKAGNLALTVGSAIENVGFGDLCLNAITTGQDNCSVGSGSGLLITTGDYNVSLGASSLNALLTGDYNIAIGTSAGTAYVAAESSNICIGNAGVVGDTNTIWIGTDGGGAGQQDTCNIAGLVSVAQGLSATTGNITAVLGDIVTSAGAISSFTTVTGGTGVTATTGDVTISAGNLVLPNTNLAGTQGEITFGGSRFISNYGTHNTFVGEDSGTTSLTVLGATDNNAFGRLSLNNIVTGARNCCFGGSSAYRLDSGNDNISIGYNSLLAVVSGINNIAIGTSAGVNYTTTESSNIVISNAGVITENNVIRIGTTGGGAGQQNKCWIAGTTGVTPDVAGAKLMIIDTAGQLGSLGAATNGQIAIGSTGANPVLATITAGAGIGVTNGAGTITIDATGSSLLPWSIQTVNMTAVVSNAYIANKAGTLEFLLPAASAVGSTFRVTGMNTALGWKITQAANQQIHFGTSDSTLGAAGYIASSATRDSVELVCVVADLEWNVVSAVGNITVA